VNTVIGDNEIQARFNGGPFGLVINNDGGDVVFGGAIDIGYEIVRSRHRALSSGKKVLGGCSRIGGNRGIENNGWLACMEMIPVHEMTAYASTRE
jgi:hypothetical protein